MSKIISATDYGNRKVIVVCLNPDDPEAVHAGGTAHTGAAPAGTDPSLKSWEWCQDCTYNWRIIQVVWTGQELYKPAGDGSLVLKADTDLLNEIGTQLPVSQSSATISALVGVDL